MEKQIVLVYVLMEYQVVLQLVLDVMVIQLHLQFVEETGVMNVRVTTQIVVEMAQQLLLLHVNVTLLIFHPQLEPNKETGVP